MYTHALETHIVMTVFKLETTHGTPYAIRKGGVIFRKASIKNGMNGLSSNIATNKI